MSRIHGKSGSLYVNLTSAGTAQAVAFLTNWTLDFSVDFVDVTALGDTNKIYVAGLPDTQGSYQGWFDDATQQLYGAAADGVARKFYLYPNTGTAQYWFGTGLFDFSVTGGVSEAAAISGNMRAASTVSKVG